MSAKMSVLVIAAGLLGLVGSVHAKGYDPRTATYNSGAWYAVKPGAGPRAHSAAAERATGITNVDGRRGKVVSGGIKNGNVNITVLHPYKSTKSRDFNGADGKSWTHDLRAVEVKRPTLGLTKTERTLRQLAPNRFKANPDIVKAVKAGKKIYKIQNSADGV